MRKVVLISLLLLSLILVSCAGDFPFANGGTRSNSVNRQYYEGNQGVLMRFSDPQSPPTRMYYYEDADLDDNSFQVLVDVHNVGSSWSRGGLYVSGYDPNMIQFDEIDIPRLSGGWSDCIVDIDFLVNLFTGSISCSDIGFNGYFDSEDSWGLRITSMGDALRAAGLDVPDGLLDQLQFSYDKQGQGGRFNLGFTEIGNLDVFNNGAGLLILMSGLSFEWFNGEEYLLQPDLPFFPGGEQTTVAFNGHVVNWPKGLDETERPVNFLVTNCYLYATHAAPQVCIDPAPFDESQKVCRPREITFNGGNGAPVAVTLIDQENTRTKVFFDITVQNTGRGSVIDMGYMERCSPYFPGRLTNQNLNKVYLLDARIGDQPLKCTPDRGDGIRLTNGRGQFRCEYTLEYVTAKSAYETPLVLELGYGYSETMQRSSTIRRVI